MKLPKAMQVRKRSAHAQRVADFRAKKREGWLHLSVWVPPGYFDKVAKFLEKQIEDYKDKKVQR